MPYITQAQRDQIHLLSKNTHKYNNPGELNYWITTEILRYIHQTGVSYQAINDVMGVLECLKAEFYARLARPYEDQKIKENFDVY